MLAFIVSKKYGSVNTKMFPFLNFFLKLHEIMQIYLYLLFLSMTHATIMVGTTETRMANHVVG